MPIVEEDHGPLGNIVAALGHTPAGVSGGAPPIAFVQQKVGSAADGSAPVTVTFDAPVAVGNSVLVQIGLDPVKAAFTNPPTMVGGGAGVLTQGIPQEPANNIWVYNYYIHGLNGETGITLQLDTAVPTAINISEWHGLANAGPIVTEIATGASDPTPALSIASDVNKMAIVSYATVGNNYQSGPTGGFTRMTPANVTGIFLETAYVLGTGSAPVWTLNSSVDWSSIGCVFAH